MGNFREGQFKETNLGLYSLHVIGWKRKSISSYHITSFRFAAPPIPGSALSTRTVARTFAHKLAYSLSLPSVLSGFRLKVSKLSPSSPTSSPSLLSASISTAFYACSTQSTQLRGWKRWLRRWLHQQYPHYQCRPNRTHSSRWCSSDHRWKCHIPQDRSHSSCNNWICSRSSSSWDGSPY